MRDPEREPEEGIEVVRRPFAEAVAEARAGRIDDAKTALALLLADARMRRGVGYSSGTPERPAEKGPVVIVGIPKEVKDNEYRIAATPEGVRELVDAGQTVLIEEGAGLGSSLSEERYKRSGRAVRLVRRGRVARART